MQEVSSRTSDEEVCAKTTFIVPSGVKFLSVLLNGVHPSAGSTASES